MSGVRGSLASEKYIAGMEVWGSGLARRKEVDSLSVFFLTKAALVVWPGAGR